MSSNLIRAFLLSAATAVLYLHAPVLHAQNFNDNQAYVNPLGAPTITTYPAGMKPADMSNDEDGDAQLQVTVGATYTYSNSSGFCQVTSVAPTVSATMAIRLPTGAPQDLKNHENGHADLYRYEYENYAKQKVEVSFNGFKGLFFVSDFPTLFCPDAAVAFFNAEVVRRAGVARDAILNQADLLGKKYDKLTEHNTNHLPSDLAVDLAVDERDRGRKYRIQKTGQPPYPYAGISDPAYVSFDPNTGLVNFSGNMLIDFARHPTDTILGRGIIQIEPLILIGKQANGSLLLSDTTFRIIDVLTGANLMDAFLFEVAYSPSSLPGFIGMIDSFLDIPPDFAGGIDNFIGSDALTNMGEFRDGGMTSFHFFVGEDPFIRTDLPGPPLGPIKGLMSIGVAIPEPGTGLLVLAGILGLLFSVRADNN